MNQSIAIIVLAAGASTRMGTAKQLLKYAGETLLRRAVSAALGSLCQPVIVVLGSQADALRIELADTAAHTVVNPSWAEGMGSSIRCGLAALEELTQGQAEALVLTLCDQPLVTASVITRLLAAYQTTRSRLVVSEYEAKGETIRGVPALFRRDLFSELMVLQGAEGARRIISRWESEAKIVAVPEGGFDVDTRDDYQALQNGGNIMGDTTVKKVQSSRSPKGEQGQKYLVSGKRVSMRLWEDEAPTDDKPEAVRDYETVGYVIKGRAELHLEGQLIRLEPGDSWLVPKGARHTYKILESFTALEATAPPAQVHGRDESE